MDIIKRAAQELKDRVNKTSQLEKLLQECTSKENWQAHPKTLNTIADYTRDTEESQIIFKYLWEKLSKADKSWIVTFKTLVLIEYLLKNGSPRCIMQFKDEIYKIRKFQDYQFLEEGEDKGASVRQRSKNIVDLLTDEDKLDNERQTAKELKEKMSSVSTGPYAGMGSNSNGGSYGSASSSSSSSKYPGFNKDSYKDQKYGGYSSKDTPTFNYKSGDPYDATEFKGLEKYRKKDQKEEEQPKPAQKQPAVIAKPIDGPKVSIAQIKIQPPSGKPEVAQPVVVAAIPAKPAAQIVDLFDDEPAKQQQPQSQESEWSWSPAPQQVQQKPAVQAPQQQVQSDFQQFQQAPQPYQQAPQVYQQTPQMQQYPSQPAQPQFQQQPYYQMNAYQQQQPNKLPTVQQTQNNPIDLFANPTPAQQTTSNTKQDFDLFSDFQTSTTSTNPKKDNYSKDEFDLINLGDLKKEADKKQKEKEAKTQNGNEFGFSTLTTQLDQFSINPSNSNFSAPNNFTIPQQQQPNYSALNNLNWGQPQYPMSGYQNGMGGVQGQQGYPVQQGYVQQGYGQPSYGYNAPQNNNFRM